MESSLKTIVTEDPNIIIPQFLSPSVPPDDPTIFHFAVADLIVPPTYVMNLPETSPESNI